MAFLDETGLAELWSLIGAKHAKIATGSYTGTGTYGASNPVTLTLGFKPKVLFITRAEKMVMPDGGYNHNDIGNDLINGMAMFTSDATAWAGGEYAYSRTIGGSTSSTDAPLPLTFTWGNTSVSWYGTVYTTGVGEFTYEGADKAQLNGSGAKYYYVAIG